MILVKKAGMLRHYLEEQAKKGKKSGFVPTMGALHQGHISLAETCKKHNDVTIASIFVNPTQFNDPADFEKYPVTIEKDIDLLEKAGVDVLFIPSTKEMYPGGTNPQQHYDLGYLESMLEGKYRPGHFQGVCMIVHRLLDIVRPYRMYIGQKDYQQCMVIKKLVDITEHQTMLEVCPTLREHDGLAMSSRNMRLDENNRHRATTIYRALLFIKENVAKKGIAQLKTEARNMLTENGFKVDYVEIAEADTLMPLAAWNNNKKAVALIAAFIGDVRLIDNMMVN